MSKNRKKPIARIAPLPSEATEKEESMLIESGRMRLTENTLDVEAFLKMPAPRISGRGAIQALLDDREESL